MSEIFHFSYLSAARNLFDEQHIERLLVDARSHNEHVGVTGMLLYNDGSFFQYFEGTELAVADVFDRIQKATSHKDITVLTDGSINARFFPDWTMGFSRDFDAMGLKTARIAWRASLARVPLDAAENPLRLILRFSKVFRLHDAENIVG